MISLSYTWILKCLRGPTPFEDMIFYLWTDSNEICTAYVKLNSKYILFMREFFDFRFSFWENYDFHVFEGYFLTKILKENKSKTINARRKTRTVLGSASNS